VEADHGQPVASLADEPGSGRRSRRHEHAKPSAGTPPSVRARQCLQLTGAGIGATPRIVQPALASAGR